MHCCCRPAKDWCLSLHCCCRPAKDWCLSLHCCRGRQMQAAVAAAVRGPARCHEFLKCMSIESIRLLDHHRAARRRWRRRGGESGWTACSPRPPGRVRVFQCRSLLFRCPSIAPHEHVLVSFVQAGRPRAGGPERAGRLAAAAGRRCVQSPAHTADMDWHPTEWSESPRIVVEFVSGQHKKAPFVHLTRVLLERRSCGSTRRSG